MSKATPPTPPPVLSVAGSDPSGGAGIQQDIKTFTALGCYGMACVTALTVQDSCSVHSVLPVEPDMVAGQMVAVVQDTVPVAMKTGMLVNAATVETVAGIIPSSTRLVIDPVMISTSGAILLDEEGRRSALRCLFPGATLLTPNIPEAEYLAEMEIRDVEGMKRAAGRITDRIATDGNGPAVLVKGGHLEGGDKVDILSAGGVFHAFTHRNITETEVHGTGCLLSAAAVSFLAHGEELVSAVQKAVSFTGQAIKNAFRTGSGKLAASPPVREMFLRTGD